MIVERFKIVIFEELEMKPFSKSMERSKYGMEARSNERRTTGHDDGPKNHRR
jgi:hypothetical protein